VPGYSFLNSRRHIPYVTDLDGEEAASLGTVLRRVTRALRQSTGASLVYVHIFGDGAAHLHLHLVPHTLGDALSTQVVRAATPDADADALQSAAERIQTALGEPRVATVV
jgi:diadenosine tetraphosphate (Ap4A) HIT family hydrolase